MMFGLDLRGLLDRAGGSPTPFGGTQFDPMANLNMAGPLGGGQYGASKFISPFSPNVTNPNSMQPFTGGAANFTQGLMSPNMFRPPQTIGPLNPPSIPKGNPPLVPPKAPPGYTPGEIM